MQFRKYLGFNEHSEVFFLIISSKEELLTAEEQITLSVLNAKFSSHTKFRYVKNNWKTAVSEIRYSKFNI